MFNFFRGVTKKPDDLPQESPREILERMGWMVSFSSYPSGCTISMSKGDLLKAQFWSTEERIVITEAIAFGRRQETTQAT